MKYFFAFLFCCFSLPVFCQIGMNSSFQKGQQVSIYTGLDFPISGYAVGVDYWFRLANRRLEFAPEINFASTTTTDFEVGGNGEAYVLENQSFAFYFNTNFYIFDFESDCDCPTFSKDGNFLKKGFFLQLSPGVSYHNFLYTESTTLPSPRVVKDEDISFSVGGGVGIDFGVSEYFTITPFAKARYHPDVEIEGYAGGGAFTEKTDNFPMWQYDFGLSLRVYLTDESSRNKRMRSRREAKRMKRRR